MEYNGQRFAGERRRDAAGIGRPARRSVANVRHSRGNRRFAIHRVGIERGILQRGPGVRSDGNCLTAKVLSLDRRERRNGRNEWERTPDIQRDVGVGIVVCACVTAAQHGLVTTGERADESFTTGVQIPVETNTRFPVV